MTTIDYNAMSSRELFSLAFDSHYRCVDRGPSYDEWREAIEAAIRKAVVRDASVGTVYVARDGADGCPEFRFRCAESLTAVSNDNVCQLCGELMPERQYVLIPSNLASKEIT